MLCWYSHNRGGSGLVLSWSGLVLSSGHGGTELLEVGVLSWGHGGTDSGVWGAGMGLGCEETSPRLSCRWSRLGAPSERDEGEGVSEGEGES
eukprot:3941605-Rhodomonas_salina.1